MTVLVLADHDLGRLSPATARIVHAVAELGPVEVLVAGPEAVAEEAARIAGVTRVRHAALDGATAEVLTPLIAGLAADYTHIVASAAAVGRDLMPRLAARLDLMPVTDVTAVLGPERFERPVYAGNAVETVASGQTRHLITLRAPAFRAAGVADAPAPIAPIGIENLPEAVRLIAEHRTESDVPDLATARIVVGGGVSVGSAEGFKLIEQLAARLGAAVGATRAAVDAGYAPNDWQVGQTGKIIAPDLYIAVGISGALQHLAGIQGAKRIVAINTDPEAPLSKLADVVLVADLFEAVPALIAELDRLGVEA